MKQKLNAKDFILIGVLTALYVDYLHDYQHHYERGWPGNKCILPIRCCNPEWYRYDASTG